MTSENTVLHPASGRGVTAALRLGGQQLTLTVPTRMYLCGITPYDVTHLGHASTFVWADTVARVLRMAGTDTVVARNVTDVDDVLTRTARERGRPFDEFGLSQEFFFDQDMAALHVRPPDHAPHARHHVRHVVRLTGALLAVGAAYERDGRVYFRGGHVPERAGLDRTAALTLAAEYGDDPADPRREDPFDVVLWQASGEGEPAWPSPWGPGRPGWHVECAAMALATLGGVVDVLAGGADLTFPHHAYVTAMAEAATGAAPFARAAFRVGTVGLGGAKMAKSTGNLVLVSDLLREVPGPVVRLMLLLRHWSDDWDYRPELLTEAANALERLYSAAGAPRGSAAAEAAVQAALLDDLDVATALAIADSDGGAAARQVLRTLALQ
ncbi:cysteinyl-tRNA synthetase [Pseudonocardia thermophila]|uniref:Cysteinyl-tRNA synthetase n=1 Tax=Pseudonocardia thermophila TaxID=1848 RepID=A0A1M6VDS2_PSETH|nr:cysteine--tRNA ligase [Pseudonocardia thermophila]SHK79632.1 cysteinyl-tRNA synthetase [Pseudonocardia thermophila]